MDRLFAGARYRSALVERPAEGWTAVELVRDADGRSELVARVTYWDAAGQFYVEVLAKDIALSLLEALIAEAKAAIPTR